MQAMTKLTFMRSNYVSIWPGTRFHNCFLIPFKGVKCVHIIFHKYASDKSNWNTLTKQKTKQK